MGIYTEKRDQLNEKIKELERHIERDTAKKKKLTEENAKLTYLSLCEQYKSSGRDLLDILANEHEQAVSLKISDTPDDENSSADNVEIYISEDNGNGETDDFSDGTFDTPEQNLFFGDKTDFYKN